jgi:isoleucyl-tRNA synthetase
MGKHFIVDGPPFTTENIGLEIAMNKVLKDCHSRFMRARGFNVIDRPGFDMHGLPVELKVEESFGIQYKTQIEEMGVDKFVSECMKHANTNFQKMVGQFKELGIWLDWERPYLTSDPSYMESVWWTIKEAHKKNMLQKQKQVTAWCPRCESPLTRGEVVYKNKTGPSVYFKIPIKGRRDEYIIVWTTTPWTFSGALAIAVNPDFNYARVAIRQGGRKSTIIVLESKVEKITTLANVEAYEVLEVVKGSQLEKLEFFHPLMGDIAFHKSVKTDWSHKILLLKSIYEGQTGSVYISPGFGTMDFKVANEFSLPIFSPLDERGLFTTEVGMKYAGQNIVDTNKGILSDMKSLRFVLTDSEEEHSFGHCWRCGTPIVHRSSEQWFLKSGEIEDKIAKAVRSVNWAPECHGHQKYYERMEKADDWCISRQRFWGTPMPIWECITDVCGHIEVVGSISDLEDGNGFSEGMDLHRPWIDKVSIECPKCGGLMKRVPDIIDVWFDSSAASWAQFSYPRKQKGFKELWPGDWISEGQDQFKGWFFNQMFTGIMTFNKVPFRKAFVHGKLMTESSGLANADGAAPGEMEELLSMHGPDALRLYLLGLDHCTAMKLDQNGIKKAYGVLNLLWNCYVFSTSYMSMDNWNPKSHPFSKVRSGLQPEDLWLLSRIETLNHVVKKEMENTDSGKAVAAISSFIRDDLSRFYIKIVRERVWTEGSSPDKDAVLFTLREVLRKLAIISSPFTPYISEYIYQHIDGDMLSVSMVPWPDIEAENLFENSEKLMNHARNIVATSQKLRQKLGLQLRWPVAKMTISASNEEITESVKLFEKVIKNMVNVKELELVPENQEWAGQELIVVPNPNIIGKAYKQRESKIARMLKVLPAKDIKAKIETGEYALGIEGEMIRILPEMVRFETKLPEGVVSIEFENGIIYLDTNQNDELTAEGFAKEISRRIQQMRNEMGLDTEEYVKISISLSDELIDTLEKWFEKMADTSRASQMEIVQEVANEDYIVEWPIMEETVTIGITSLNIKKAMNEFMVVKDVDSGLALSIVESGIKSPEQFISADREELLKIPGMNHSKLRKIKEYFETPEERRISDDQTCPVCLGTIDSGTVICQRCGKSLISDEAFTVESVIDYDDEPEYYQAEKTREKVKIGKKKKVDVVPAQPEDEIIKMAADAREPRREPEPEDLLTSEIMTGIELEETRTTEPELVPEVLKPSPEPRKEEEPLADRGTFESHPEVKKQPPETEGKAGIVTGQRREILKQEETEPKTEPVQDMVENIAEAKGRISVSEPETKDNIANAQKEIDVALERRPSRPAEQAPNVESVKEIEIDVAETQVVVPLEPESLLKETASPTIKEVRKDEDYLDSGFNGKSEIIDSQTDREIMAIAEAFDIKVSAAKELFNNGYKSVESLATATEESLREIKGVGKVTARRIVQKSESSSTKICSLCNAIVPINSPACTRCGVKFITGTPSHKDSEQQKSHPLEEMEKRFTSKPSDATLLQSKATTLMDAGKNEEALAVLNDALIISPGNESLERQREQLMAQMKSNNNSYFVERKSMKNGNEELTISSTHEQTKSMKTDIDNTLEGLVMNEPEIHDTDAPGTVSEIPVEDTAGPSPAAILGPKIEETQAELSDSEINLKQSFTYLVLEERSAKSYRMFKQSISEGMPAYCVTRTFPEKIRERYELGSIPILWLSNVAKEEAVRPKDLEKLSLSLEEFLGKDGGIILLDGIEYLITNNNFITVLKLIQSLRDQVAINSSILLLSINPSTMDLHQINLLKREVDSVIE